MRRFFCQEPIGGARVVLTGEEAHHLLRVDRIRIGETVTLFDGLGGEHVARLAAAGGASAELDIVEHHPEDRLPATRLVLACAMGRGRHMDALVQMTCELGVAALWPVVTRRSVVRGGEGKIEHWRRIVVESCKQSGRNRLMEVEPPMQLPAALARASGHKFVLSTETGTRPLPELLTEATGGRPAEVALLVGPEGGFTEEEVSAAARSGFAPAGLTPTVLRIETAAVAASALVLLTLG